MRVVELIMPAIAPIEDLRAAQEELLDKVLKITTYGLRHTVTGGKSVRCG